jgi:lipopolysaccharide/colanic/teichoic acid biosynthesis glycosyltransferase
MTEISPVSSTANSKARAHKYGQGFDTARRSKALLALSDLAAAGLGFFIASTVSQAVGILTDSNPFEFLFIPLFLVSCFTYGLYGYELRNPLRRFRRRLAAIALAGAVALPICTLAWGLAAAFFYTGVASILLLLLSVYFEKALTLRTALVTSGIRSHLASSVPPSYGSLWLYSAVKRSIDYLVVSVSAPLAAPLIALSVLAIKIVDPGNAFYWQERIGHHGKRTRILKLRTMYTDAQTRLEQYLQNNSDAKAEWQTFFKLRNDPRILPGVGHFLRRSSLDELPQLWNVLRGDMTLVGPRPFPPYHVNRFDPEFQHKRASVVPGLTGLWQVEARSNGDLDTQKGLDLFYIDYRSLWLDLYILIETIPAVLSGKGAR